MAFDVEIEKIIPLGGAGELTVSEVTIIINDSDNIYDGFIQSQKDEVVKLTQEVREAHDCVHEDKAEVNALTQEVREAHDCVHEDKEYVNSKVEEVNSRTEEVNALTQEVREAHDCVHEDKATVANDKSIVIENRDEALDFANQAELSKIAASVSEDNAAQSVVESANNVQLSINEADRARDEADRAQSIADGINITGGIVDGNLTVTGDIIENGEILYKKYARIDYVDGIIDELKGGVDSTFDTMKEIQDAIQNNEGGIGDLTNAVADRAKKAGDTFTGVMNFTKEINTNGNVNLKNGSMIQFGDIPESMYGNIIINNNGAKVEVHRDGAVNSSITLSCNHADPTWLIGGNKVYHEGLKPTWNDVNGNEYFNKSLHIKAADWIQSSSEATGILPDIANTTGRSYIGKNDWWFKSAYIAEVNAKEVLIGGFRIKTLGDELHFMV